MKHACRNAQLACALLLVVAACDSSGESAGNDADRGHTIALGSMVIDIRGASADGVSLSSASGALATRAGDHVLVKYPGPVSSAQLEALAASAQIYTYVPHDSFLVRFRASAGLTQAAPGATWVGAYKPEYKLAAATSAAALAASSEAQTVMVTIYPDANLDGVMAVVKQLSGATVVGAERGQRFSRIRLRVNGPAIAGASAALAAIDDVLWVDLEAHRELFNDTTVWVGQSGLAGGQTTPVWNAGIHGEGQVVGYIDTGIDADSCYFRDPARALPPTNACGGTLVDNAQRKIIGVDFLWQDECLGGISTTEWDTQGHGSHVAGTIAGDNFANPITHDPGDGMAPGAKLVVQDGGFRTDNCADLPGIGCAVVDLKPIFQQAYDQGARIHSNSWGDRENAAVQNTYSAACQDVDEFMFGHPDFLILFAAGNSGPGTGTVGSPSVAKNTISVGATLRGTSANSMASFSSCGPTADGRFKPDLTMPGSSITSAGNDLNVTTNNCGTATMSGTSMATPGAAGMAALVRQYYADGYYPTGAAVTANRFTPSAALIKATMLNSTATMTGSGAGAMPGNCQGWGRVLLDDSLFFSGQARTLIAVDEPGFPLGGAGQVKTYTVQVAAGQPLRATLAWTDFPSTPVASINLNNDLDLDVSGPSGTFHGNVFAANQSTTGGVADRRNNVEQVLISAPLAGTYTITVRAFNVPSSAQAFSLVVSGGVTTGGGGNRAPIANAGPDAGVVVGAAVTLNGSASSDPDGTPLTFAWAQTGGPTVTLSTPTAAIAGFTPTVIGTYTFALTVSDGTLTSTDSVVITVTAASVVVFSDDFEVARGWTTNAAATDTATLGQWERGDPAATVSTGNKQLGTTTSGTFDLVTGAAAGASAGAFDVDGGITTIRSPAIAIPAGGTVTLSLQYYFSHLSNSSSADFFRVRVIGATSSVVLEELGSALNDDAVWTSRAIDISAFAGQTVQLQIEAADAGTASLVEAAVDDVVIRRQ
jgi:subtilisin family serine protease